MVHLGPAPISQRIFLSVVHLWGVQRSWGINKGVSPKKTQDFCREITGKDIHPRVCRVSLADPLPIYLPVMRFSSHSSLRNRAICKDLGCLKERKSPEPSPIFGFQTLWVGPRNAWPALLGGPSRVTEERKIRMRECENQTLLLWHFYPKPVLVLQD